MKNLPLYLALAGVALLVARLHVATSLPEAVETVQVEANDPVLVEAFARVADALESKAPAAVPLKPDQSEIARALRERGLGLDPQDFRARLEVLRQLETLGPDMRPYVIELSLRILETTAPVERRLSDDEIEAYRAAIKILAQDLDAHEYVRLTREIRSAQAAAGHDDDWNELLPLDATEGTSSDIQ